MINSDAIFKLIGFGIAGTITFGLASVALLVSTYLTKKRGGHLSDGRIVVEYVAEILTFLFAIITILALIFGPDIDHQGNDVLLNRLENRDVRSGDTVSLKVTKVEQNDMLGDIVWVGEKVYIIGYSDVLDVKEGDTIIFDIGNARNLFGAWALEEDN